MASKESRQVLSRYGVFIVFSTIISPIIGVRFRQTEATLDRPIWNSKIEYKTLEFEVPVDHFSFANQDTFKLRYLVADQFWEQNNGPVFFYTGNEGDITWFCNNTGFMWDIAPEFKAMLVFAEHRYYGTSMPYGKDSYKDPEHLGYLTSEQALADFVSLITHMKATTAGLDKAPFIAFGGSYGGMLAAWIRMKYPHAIQGSLAASAPIWYFGDLTPCDSFYRITTDDFSRESTSCVQNINTSWSVITDMGKTESGRGTLSKLFKLCKPLQTVDDVSSLRGWLAETYGNMAMVDYPYEANFLEPLPAWPIKEACKYLNQGLTGADLITGLSKAVGVYYNYTGHAQCYNITQQASASLGDLGWSFQACTEMVMPMCSNGKTDMFEANPWNFTAFALDCKKQWGVVPRPRAAIMEYGGRNIQAASNIIFSNGKLDPWSGAGVMTSVSKSLVAIVIEEGAHHLDLRSSNPKDPQSVITARNQEKDIIRQWITQYAEETAKRQRTGGSIGEMFIKPTHTTSGTHAVVFGIFAVVVFAVGALFFLKIRSPPKVKVVRCSAAPVWTNIDTNPGSLYPSTESLKDSERWPLLK